MATHRGGAAMAAAIPLAPEICQGHAFFFAGGWRCTLCEHRGPCSPSGFVIAGAGTSGRACRRPRGSFRSVMEVGALPALGFVGVGLRSFFVRGSCPRQDIAVRWVDTAIVGAAPPSPGRAAREKSVFFLSGASGARQPTRGGPRFATRGGQVTPLVLALLGGAVRIPLSRMRPPSPHAAVGAPRQRPESWSAPSERGPLTASRKRRREQGAEPEASGRRQIILPLLTAHAQRDADFPRGGNLGHGLGGSPA